MCPVGARTAACDLLCVLALPQAPEHPQVAHLPLVGERRMKSLRGLSYSTSPPMGAGHVPAAGDWDGDGEPHSPINRNRDTHWITLHTGIRVTWSGEKEKRPWPLNGAS